MLTQKPPVKPSAQRGRAALARRFAFAAMLSLTTAGIAGPGYAQGSDPKGTVQGFYDTLLGTMQNARALGERGRYAKLEPAVSHTFDIPDMTRLAVGAAWSKLSEDQRRRAIDAFGRYITATYADRFDGYSGEKFRVTGQQDSGYGTVVQTEIVKSNGEPVNINYLMRQNGGVWQVEDIYLTGSISEIATRHSEFGSVLRRDGVEGLIALLNRKADNIVGATS